MQQICYHNSELWGFPLFPFSDFTRTCWLLWGFLRQIKLSWQNSLKISKDVYVLQYHDMATTQYKVDFYFCQGVDNYRLTSVVPCLRCNFTAASPVFLWKFSDALRCFSCLHDTEPARFSLLWDLSPPGHLDGDPSLTECSFCGVSRTLVIEAAPLVCS